ncbi:integrator complex subunit 7 [Drosophila sulfurigaster albostrigata]|uniref:integrator complex subunit 7 n=1 Tax=Drosophila sulfurigaster albostrigata TaxID=89887 RepID=UPI002D21E167|nr:integrator complex subunit 7 [Drosophila sulfurigaster albostrigata]
MAHLTGTRVSMFNESFLNDNEHDSNAVLMELDKGLRSAKQGIQCEAIVRFPRLFEKYPFPILINSSFIKLAEFFVSGSNLLRFWVLRVCQQSENHLDKILNIDNFVRRIFMVMHSNDPVARALLLRTLGAVSRVIPEKPQVHHAIRRALDSHDTVEVEAAIYASSCFAAQSSSFAISMCAKISDMIESLQVPVPMKLLLIPVLRHMHHDANTAALVSKLCLELLPKYPAQSFVVAIINTLTQLSSRTLVGVPGQLNVLLEFMEDLRTPVRIQVLRSFNELAGKQSVNAWPKPAIGALISKFKLCRNGAEQFLFLSILLKLSECPLTCQQLLLEHREALLRLCVQCISKLDDYTTATQAMAVLSALVAFGAQKQLTQVDDILQIVNLHMEGVLLCTARRAECTRDLRRVLTYGIRITQANAEFGADFIELVSNTLGDNVVYPPANAQLICEALVGLCEHFQLRKYAFSTAEGMDDDTAMETDQPAPLKVNPLLAQLPLILYKLKKVTESETDDQQLRTVEILSALICQTTMGCYLPQQVVQCFELCIERVNCWTLYRIARTASRYGHHYVAAHIYTKVSQIVISDHMHYFLVALAQISQAECILNYGLEYAYMRDNYAPREAPEPLLPLMKRLESASNLYQQALASMRACSSPQHPCSFQLEYLKIRAQFLQTLHLAVTVKNAQVIVPPPAIAGSLAQNSRDYLQKFGHVTNQLRKLVKSLKACEETYARLYKSSFDADNVTLEFLEVAEFQCALFAHIIESICYATPPEPPVFLTTGTHPETRYFAASCQRMEQMQKNLPQELPNAKTISNRHLDVIIALIEIITKTPLCLPRYFFQILQSTQIKLSVSPQPRSATEPVLVQSGSNLVIKVEGVLQHFSKQQKHFRRVDSVQLSLTSQLMSPRPVNELVKLPNNDTVTLNQIVKPQRDFLSGSFLLPISSGGQFQVTLETFVIDEHGITWCTGPKSSMVVRVMDDPSKPAAVQVASTSQAVSQARRF